MSHYFAFGLILDSEVELPDLIPSSQNIPDVLVRVARIAVVVQPASSAHEYVVNEGAGTFLIRDGREILVDPAPSASLDSLQLLLLGRVMAILLRQRGWIPLHASAVLVGGSAVLFLGASGAGKSTTAAAFHTAGYPVLTDDVAAVRDVEGNCMLRPGRSVVRLLPDSRNILVSRGFQSVRSSDKDRFDLGRFGVGECPVHKIYVVQTGDTLGTAPMELALATAVLNRHTFLKRLRSLPEVIEANLRGCAAISTLVPVSRLVRPLSLDLLPALIQYVEEDVRQLRF